MAILNDKRNQELEELKLVYYDIIEGCSFDTNTGFYIKHFGETESHLITTKKQELTAQYLKQGVPYESELLKIAIQDEQWSETKENHILELKYLISDNEKAILNIIIQQRQIIEKVLEEKRKELVQILWERQQSIGRSLESIVNEEINDYISYLSFYKDRKCTQYITNSYDEFQNQESEFLVKLNNSLSAHCAKFKEDVIQTISCLPFFLNKFSYCKDNIYYFLGIPIARLTYHQNYLLSLGSRNLTVTNQAKGNPPEIDLCQSLDEVVKWYNVQFSLMISKK